MDVAATRQRLLDALLAFAWDEWAQMGVLAAVGRRSPWAQDPEALVLFTLEVARADPRLFDELMDWLVVNGRLLSVRRLHALCLDDEDRALLAAALAWLARHRPHVRSPAAAGAAPSELVGLFGDAPITEHDPDFARAGFARARLRPSGKSTAPDLRAPINLAFRLRQLLGVSVRAEVVRVLLGIDTPRVTAQLLARSTGYAKRNVHEAITSLVAADVVTAVTVGGEQRCSARVAEWATLLRLEPDRLPIHRDWPQVLGALRRLLRWTGRTELAAMSDYMRASQTRDLLEELRPHLAFAGIPVDFSGPGPAVWDDLADLIEHLLRTLDEEAA